MTIGRMFIMGAALAGAIGLFGAPTAAAQAGYQYQAGDRVSCNLVGSNKPEYEKYYEPGTVLAFRPGDGQDGSWFRVKADSNGVEYYCKLEVIRPLAPDANGGAPQPMPAAVPARPAQPWQQPQAPAPAPVAAAPNVPQGAFLDCPVQQAQVRNGARPDPELIKKLIRCKKGEQAVPPGQEGAVKVDVGAVQIGTPRPWSYGQDTGNGQEGTTVYPVRATFGVRTLYRAATEYEDNWVRIFNVYVDAFGEWQIGSEEPVRPATTRRVNN